MKRNTMSPTYIVVPGLVSIETNIRSLNDFLLAQNLSFYSPSKRQPNHYKVFLTDHVELPRKWDYRIGNYVIHGDSITYNRPLVGSMGFRYRYNFRTKEFIGNFLYRYHNVNIGDIFTIGRHLFHIIECDLAMDRKFILLGAAVAKHDKTIILLAPNGNGKTKFVNDALDKGYSYVSENFLIMDILRDSIHGIGPVFHNKGRASNRSLAQRFSQGSVPIVSQTKIQKVFLVSPSPTLRDKKQITENYVSTYSGYYGKNNLVRTMMYYAMKNSLLEKNYSELVAYLEKKVTIIDDFSPISL